MRTALAAAGQSLRGLLRWHTVVIAAHYGAALVACGPERPTPARPFLPSIASEIHPTPDASVSSVPLGVPTTWNGTECVELQCALGLRLVAGQCVYSDGMPCLGGCDAESVLVDAPNSSPVECRTLAFRAAARAIAGVDLSVCRVNGMPTGGGTVMVTFARAGGVETVSIDRPPFAGTPVGVCIAEQLKNVRIPMFSGGPIQAVRAISLR